MLLNVLNRRYATSFKINSLEKNVKNLIILKGFKTSIDTELFILWKHNKNMCELYTFFITTYYKNAIIYLTYIGILCLF